MSRKKLSFSLFENKCEFLDDEYVKFMKMKQKMIAKGKISESESDGDGDDEFAEFMRWKQQKRRAARRGLDDWDQA